MKFLPPKIGKGNAYTSQKVADPNAGGFVYTNDIGSPRSKKAEAHTAPTKYGMGDYYGRAYKAPLGRVRSNTVGYRPVTRKQMGTPPKSVV